MWLYGSGFPKSMNIGLAIDKKYGVDSKVIGQNQDILLKQKKDLETGHRKILDSLNAGAQERNNGFTTVSADIKEPTSEYGKKYKGWGTALKPSFEPIIVARKPLDGTCVNNVLKWGVGGINIDECRVGTDERTYKGMSSHKPEGAGTFRDDNWQPKDIEVTVNGRFPANTILTYDDTDYDEICGGFPNSGSGNNGKPYNYAGREYNNKHTSMFNGDKPQAPSNYNDSGSACRYFYNAKASKKDRDEGLENFDVRTKVFNDKSDKSSTNIKDVEQRFTTQLRNTHPTVKPTTLMQYLIRLVTPRGGTILDPFMGSGSTGKAAAYENKEREANYKFIGIELDTQYCEIAKARIEFANKDK